MRACGDKAEGVETPRDSTSIGVAEPRWGLAFLAVLGYALVIRNISLMLDVMMFETVKAVLLPRGSR